MTSTDVDERYPDHLRGPRRLMAVWCRILGHHNWLIGTSVSRWIPTSDFCLTCEAVVRWPAEDAS